MTVVAGPTHGTLTPSSNGSFSYAPTASYVGPDSFTYTASDGLGGVSAATTVSITVKATNTAPVAVNDSYTTTHGHILTVAAWNGVLANDTDADGDPLSVTLVTAPTAVTLTLNSDGSFVFDPGTSIIPASLSFVYAVSDGTTTAQATASISVTNAAPVAHDDHYNVLATGATTISANDGVLANDTDADDTPTATLVSGPAHGSLTFNSDGSFVFTPDGTFTGSDSFTYDATDGYSTSLATVTLVTNPVAQDDSYTLDHNTDFTPSASWGVLANDQGASGVTLEAVLVTQGQHGTATLNSDGSFVYHPNADYVGTDSFQYEDHAGSDVSNIATVTLKVTDEAPTAPNNAYSVETGQSLVVAAPGLRDQAYDPDDVNFTFVLEAGTQHGTLQFNSNGTFTYDATPGYIGSDTFTYQTFDGTLTSATTGTVTITITPATASPTITSADHTTFTVGEIGFFEVTSSGFPTPTLTYSNGTLPGGVTLTDRGNGTALISATPPTAGTDGTYTFTITASNGVGTAATQSFTLTINPDVITATNDSYQVNAGSQLSVSVANGVLKNDSSAIRAALTVTVSTSPSHGTLTLSSSGALLYTPTATFSGTDVAYYTATDSEATSAPTAITFNVNASGSEQNIAQPHTYAIQTATQLSVSPGSGVLSDAVSGIPGTEMNADLVSGVSHGTLNLNTDGSFTYTSASGFVGTDSFTFCATTTGIGSLTSANETVTIYVVPKVDIVGHQAGTMGNPGAAVSEANEDDPTNLLVLSTNTPSSQALFALTPNLVEVTLKSLNLPAGGTGTVSLVSNDPANVQFFDSTGSLLKTSALTIDLATASGPLAGILNSDVNIFVQVLTPEADLQVSLRYAAPNLTANTTTLLAAAGANDKVDMFAVGIQLDWLNYAYTNIPIVIDGQTAIGIPVNPNVTLGSPGSTVPDASAILGDDLEWARGLRDKSNSQSAWQPDQAAPVAIAAGEKLTAQLHVSILLPTTNPQHVFVQSISLIGVNTSAMSGSMFGNLTGNPITLGNGDDSGVGFVESTNASPVRIDSFNQTFDWQLGSLVLNVTNLVDNTTHDVQMNSGSLTTWTTNRVYTLLNSPQAVTGMDEPWATALELSTNLARGATTDAQAASRMTQGIYDSSWRANAGSVDFIPVTARLIYDPDATAFQNTSLPNGTVTPQIYDLANFIATLGGTFTTQRCQDNANLDAILLRSLGVSANVITITGDPAIITNLTTNLYYRGGNNTPTVDGFNLHEVVTLAQNDVANAPVYDPSVRGVDYAISPDPAVPVFSPGPYYLGQLSLTQYERAVFVTPANPFLNTIVNTFGIAPPSAIWGALQIMSATVTQGTGTDVLVVLKGVGFNSLINRNTILLSDAAPPVYGNNPYFLFMRSNDMQVSVRSLTVVDNQTINLTLTVAAARSRTPLWIVVRKNNAPITRVDGTGVTDFANLGVTVTTDWWFTRPGGAVTRIMLP